MSENTKAAWTDPIGNRLAFQDGDYVRIDTSGHPHKTVSLPFLEGYVRGYNLQQDSTDHGASYSAAYELFKMGHNPLRWVREEFLVIAPELVPHDHDTSAHCGICGYWPVAD